MNVPLEAYPLAVVSRSVFDAHLCSLAESAGARIVEGRFRGLDGNSAEIVTPSGLLSVEAKQIVAADGVHSKVRRLLTGKLPDRVLTLYAKVPDTVAGGCGFRFGKAVAPGHYAWAFVHAEGSHIGLAANDEKAIHAHFGTFCRELGLKEIPNPKGYYIPRWKDDLYHMGNVYFVGDAAGQVLPFTYEGIYYAMRSAAYAAEAILHGEPERYRTLWQANLQRRFRAMNVLQKLLLRWDRTAEKMVRLQDKPAVRAAAMRILSGRSVPASSFQTLVKGVKLLFR